MCKHCNIMFSNGEMSPRMWKCPETGEIKCFTEIQRIIDKYSVVLGIEKEKAKELAYNFLTLKQSGPGVYFCEDYFADDLEKHFENMLVQLAKGISKHFDSTMKFKDITKDKFKQVEPNYQNYDRNGKQIHANVCQQKQVRTIQAFDIFVLVFALVLFFMFILTCI